MEALRVLIVDDSQDMQEELGSLFKQRGHQVVGTASNGLEALKKAKELNPDLITLDIIMPEMDGIETYRKLRLLEKKPRVLFISALANEARVLQAYEHEISSEHYCAKPVIEDFLFEKISKVMQDEAMALPETQLEEESLTKELPSSEFS